jgi:transcriptional regulator with XRE-family HTH domain
MAASIASDMEQYAESFAEIVRRRRLELGLSQIEVSDAVGMSQRWTSAVETGEIKVPRVETIRRLSKVLSVPVADLLIAAKLAETRAEAERIVQTVPEEDDPLMDIVMAGARDLTPEGREILAGIITSLKKTHSAGT